MCYTPQKMIFLMFFLFHYTSADLTYDVCKQTRDYNLCIETLKTDVYSSGADAKGLARIMIQVARKKAVHNLVYVRKLMIQNPQNPDFKQCLQVCYDDYHLIVTAFIPNALKSLSLNSSFDAAISGLQSADQVSNCQETNCVKLSSNLNDKCNKYADFTQLVVDVIRTV
ncbi:cell wall / vacuolar inhibitor of fructosidase 1-like [Lycium barbarum]|uniref:cell wall / vacuolar inhibitor of fructosidase 1-like n=1 Tax=Lycium barbarum TaxID=112863 RepID=UPI00293E3663|nr:cell wall / vacuolar inhibitor of fructosidase 1-like [Lycium barbarum]